jgi:ketosteroid isomerase-like protein
VRVTFVQAAGGRTRYEVGMADIPRFLVELEEAFDAAMVSNDVEQIARCVSDDWLLITPEAGPVSRAAIFEAVRSGSLTHATMTKQATRARVLGDVAWVTGRGQNTGTFRGAPLEADEYITDVYHRQDGIWRCVLTHLTPVRK